MAAAKRVPRPARNVQRVSRSYNGAVREQLADLQRARILSAMFDVACERGAGNVSVAHVVERSGVSRRTFYEAFTDREDCFLAAIEQALSLVSACVLPAYQSEKGWRERIRAGLVALLSFIEDEPRVARLLICESLAGGPSALERRAQVIAQLTHAIDGARQDAKSVVAPPLTAEGIVGGVLAVIQSRLTGGGDVSPSALVNPLMSMIVLPYLGAQAARRELERPLPTPATAKRRESPTLLADPFKEVGMRLTYRTLRVLMAIANLPGGSNRAIGEMAGITDQGQISKLLNRLERIGLVQNTGLGPGTGAPNAWELTGKGGHVTDGIRAHTNSEGEES